MRTLIVNLYGGPGTGKSTTCAGIFHFLKIRGVNCEMSREYAKDRVWEGSRHVLDNQIYIFGKQHHRLWNLLGKVDVVITDSPLLNSILYYEGENSYFPSLVASEHQKLCNLNIFLERAKPYNPSGRLQSADEARELDGRILEILDDLGEQHFTFRADESAAEEIGNMVLQNYQDINTPFGVIDRTE